MSIEKSENRICRVFSSDNAAGIDPAVMAAIEAANVGHAVAYGKDAWTDRAVAIIRRNFSQSAEVAFTFGGTGANIVGLSALANSYHSIVCAESSHLWRDECGSAERLLGCKLLPLPAPDGKLAPDRIVPLLADRGIVHRSQPRVVSVSQPTELGTVYTVAELQALGEFCRNNELYLHVDGARLANAAASLGVSLKAVSTDCGVDVLSFGGTKIGLLAGEAVLSFQNSTTAGLRFHHKQCGQLVSKTRFIAAQFEALLTNDLWLRNARHSNVMASMIASAVEELDNVEIIQPVESNVVFLQVSEVFAQLLYKRFRIPVWHWEGPVVRVMTAYDTTEEDVEQLVAAFRTGIA